MLQQHEKRGRPSYSDGGLNRLETHRNEALRFFEKVNKEAGALLLDLYEYSPEIRKLIDKKGHYEDKFRGFKFTAEIGFNDNDEAFFDFTLFGADLCYSWELLKDGYWTGEEGGALTFDFDDAGDALRAMVRDIEAFENDGVHEGVSVEAFDLVKTAIHGMLQS